MGSVSEASSESCRAAVPKGLTGAARGFWSGWGKKGGVKGKESRESRSRAVWYSAAFWVV